MSEAVKRIVILSSLVMLGGPACGEDEPAPGTGGAGGEVAGTGGATGGGGGAGGQSPSLAETYCSCMLDTCHDAYHEAFGPETDEPAARAACLTEAEALPVAGMDVDSGNFIECRLHYCEIGVETQDNCDASIGEGACAP